MSRTLCSFGRFEAARVRIRCSKNPYGVAGQTIYTLNELLKLLGRGEARCAQGTFKLSSKETGEVDFERHDQRSIVNVF